MLHVINGGIRQAILTKVFDVKRFEEINGANTLNFSTILDEKTKLYLTEDSVIELDNDYFDVAYYKKNKNEDGSLTMEVETEHISYRLNNTEYDIEYYASTGLVATLLAELLDGTGFTVGTVDILENATYITNEKMSRRQMLLQFAAIAEGELKFDGYVVSLLLHRGSETPSIFTTGKNINILAKIFNKREKDKDGNSLVSYTCNPIKLPSTPVALGDDILLIQKDLGIQETLRIVKVTENPFNLLENEIEIANFVSNLEEGIFQVITNSVAKGKIYNGVSIGPDDGLVVERSDGLAKTIMNATEGISIYSELEVGVGLTKNFFVGLAGRIKVTGIDITGGSISWSNVIDQPTIPSQYTDFMAVTAWEGSTYKTQLDSKIETYYTDTDPNTWSSLDRTKHTGDMWYALTAKLLKRYNGASNLWELVEDQKAIDAYTDASTAQDTADSKRRVFVATPTTPYDVGDLWSGGSTGDLKRCNTQRLTGAYVATDWELATKYNLYTNAEALAAWVASGYHTYIDAYGVYTGTVAANKIIIGGANGNISFNDLTDKPTIPAEYTDADALAAWVASDYQTYIDAYGVYSGVLLGNLFKTATDAYNRIEIDSAGLQSLNSSHIQHGISLVNSTYGYSRLEFYNGGVLGGLIEYTSHLNTSMLYVGTVSGMDLVIAGDGSNNRFLGVWDFSSASISGLSYPSHNHDGSYSAISHNHSGSYAALSHDHGNSYIKAVSQNVQLSVSAAGIYVTDGTNHGTILWDS